MDKNEKCSQNELFVRYIKTRDEATFKELFRQVDAWLFVTMYALTGSREEADDIIQESWVSVIENADRFDPKRGKFSNYIFTIAKNISLQNKRKKKKYNEMLEHMENGVEDSELQSEFKELGVLLRQGIRNLKQQQCQDTLILYYFGGFNIKEIADMFNTHEYNILNWLKRGRKQLEKDLRKHKDFETIYETIIKMISISYIMLELLNG